MKKILPTIFSLALLAVNQANAQEPPEAIPVRDQEVVIASGTDAQITGGISDGKPSLPAPKPEPIAFDVKSTITRRIHVVESPEMQGLPAPEGDIKVTLQLVKDPGLTDPLPPLPALPPDDPAVLARMAELSKTYRETQLVFVSATVYDHSRTYLRCYPSGDGNRREIACWSNLDFNHFSGFATYQVNGADGETRQYGLMMGIGNEDTKQRAEMLANHDITYKLPEIPTLPDLATSGPAFVITEGDTADTETMELIEGMHTLYRAEGPRMEAAYQARTLAYEERKAFLLAHPPKPKDVTIHFWKRNAATATQSNIEGGKGQ
ncbi:MAG: hypothetical protein ABI600_08780 [Luteolibacter sp.]